MPARLRILCTGDLHIGRRPSRLPSSIDARASSCAAAWEQIVEYARRERLDVVLVSGDWVDRDNRFYEAYGPLERGLRELEQAGIDTIAVAGNHDFDVLPRLADHFGDDRRDDARFRLLGRGGRWERCSLRRDGQLVLHVDGWSFPSESVTRNPLSEYVRQTPPRTGDADGAVPSIGLLHCDVDQPQSRYAPVALSDFSGTAHALWLLGHVHQFKVHRPTPASTVMYPGSPQAMDPGEPGAHGPWLVELDVGSARHASVSPIHLPMSKVRYDTLAVDVAGVETREQLEGRLVQAVRAHVGTLAGCCGPLRYASVRLTLTGRTRLHRRLRECCGPIIEDLDVRHGDFVVGVERVDCETKPALELRQLAVGNDAPAVLARLVLDLDEDDRSRNGTDAGAQLVNDTLARVADLWRAKSYQPIAADAEPDERDVRRILSRQAYLLLDELLAQRESEEEVFA